MLSSTQGYDGRRYLATLLGVGNALGFVVWQIARYLVFDTLVSSTLENHR